MDRDLVFRLKADPDLVQVAAGMKQIADLAVASPIRLKVDFQFPDLQAIETSIKQLVAARPIVIPVTLQATGVSGLTGGLSMQGSTTVTQMAGAVVGGGLPAMGTPAWGAQFAPTLSNTSPAPTVANSTPVAGDAGVDQFAAFRTKEAPEEDKAKEHLRALEEGNEKIDRLNQTVNQGLRAGLYQTFEAVTRLGRGFAYIGAVGEEDVRKVLDTLMKVEATINLVRGGIDVFRGLSQAVGSYRQGLEAVSAIQTAVDAKRVAAGVSDVAGDAVGGAAGAAAGGGALSKIGGAAGFGGMAVPAAALGAIAGAGLGINAIYETGRDAMEYGFMGGNRPGSAGATVGGMMASTDTWIMRHTPRFARSAMDSVGLKGAYAYALQEEKLEKFDFRTQRAMEARARREAGRNLELRDEQQTLSIGQQSAGDVRDIEGMAMSTPSQLLEQDERDRQINESTLSMTEASSRFTLAGATDMGTMRRTRRGIDESEFARAQSRINSIAAPVAPSDMLSRAALRNASAMEDTRAQSAMFARQMESKDLSVDAAAGLKNKAEESAQKLVDLEKERKQIAQQTAKEMEDGLTKSALGLQELAKSHREMAASLRESLMGNQERLGLMDESDKSQIKSAAGRVKKIEEMEAAGDMKGAEDLRQSMSREDISLLQSTGFKKFRDFGRSEGMRRFKKDFAGAGYDAEELETIDRSTSLADEATRRGATVDAQRKEVTEANREAARGGRIEVELRDNREINVNVIRDDEAVISRMAETTREILVERDAKMIAAFKAEIESERMRMNQANKSQQAAGAASRQR